MLTAIHVSEGQRVSAGDVLFTLETTKSTEDVAAETGGYVAGMHASPGQTVSAGELFCYLADALDWIPPVEALGMEQELGPEKGLTPIKGPTPGMRSSSSKTPAKTKLLVETPVADKNLPKTKLLVDASAADGVPGAEKGLTTIRGQSPGMTASSLKTPTGLRITMKALALAQEASLDLAHLPVGPLVTEQMVKDLIANQGVSSPQAAAPAPISRLPQLVIYGGGGHGKALIDLLRSLGIYHLAGIVDDGVPIGADVMGLPVLGGKDALANLYAQGIQLAVNAVGGIGSIKARIMVFQHLTQAGFTCPAVVHPTAWVEPSASLAAGVQVFPHAYVGSEAQIGFGTIINTGAIVSHECVLGDFVNISPGALLAGRVHVGTGALLGMGVTVNLQVQIGPGARVGNSATVIGDVPSNGIVRAGTVHP